MLIAFSIKKYNTPHYILKERKTHIICISAGQHIISVIVLVQARKGTDYECRFQASLEMFSCATIAATYDTPSSSSSTPTPTTTTAIATTAIDIVSVIRTTRLTLNMEQLRMITAPVITQMDSKQTTGTCSYLVSFVAGTDKSVLLLLESLRGDSRGQECLNVYHSPFELDTETLKSRLTLLFNTWAPSDQ